LISAARRPPRSPLFPYTTLFRSEPHPPVAGRPGRAGQREHLPGPLDGLEAVVDHQLAVAARDDAVGLAVGAVPEQEVAALLVLQDRKSTRLNSSHVKISYAVFCL